MYIHNDFYRGYCRRRWWGLSEGGELKLKLMHRGGGTSAYGKETMRRWIKRGYCPTSDGELRNRWTLIMLASKARYLMTLESNHVTLNFITPGGKRPTGMRAKIQECEAFIRLTMAKFITNSGESGQASFTYGGWHGLWDFSVNGQVVDYGNGLASGFTLMLRLPPDGGYAKSHPAVLDAIVRIFGHPLRSNSAKELATSLVYGAVKCEIRTNTRISNTRRYQQHDIMGMKLTAYPHKGRHT